MVVLLKNECLGVCPGPVDLELSVVSSGTVWFGCNIVDVVDVKVPVENFMKASKSTSATSLLKRMQIQLSFQS